MKYKKGEVQDRLRKDREGSLRRKHALECLRHGADQVPSAYSPGTLGRTLFSHRFLDLILDGFLMDFGWILIQLFRILVALLQQHLQNGNAALARNELTENVKNMRFKQQFD